MTLSDADRDVLCGLADEVAGIAALPVHRKKAELWRRLNRLEKARPLVWINEICWHEMNVDDELTIRTTYPWAQGQEGNLRRLLYQWRHLPGDMIVSDYLACPLSIRSTGFGLSEDVDVARMDAASGVVSRRFHPQIVEPEDIDKIQMPTVTHDQAATDENYGMMRDVYGDILPVRKVGLKGIWFAPWDELIRWWGVEQAMMDLVLRPQMVNDAMTRLVDAYLCQLDQWEDLNLLSLNNDNTRIGSGAYGYTDELPGDDYDADHVRPKNMWGCATAQIFSEVSPEMHWEFALEHEMRYLQRWALTYYGCCEPLDIKMGVLRRVPNLRKVSMSPWIKVDRAVEAVGRDYVFSHKPNPAVLAEDDWRPDFARSELRRVLDKTGDCRVELILKDISTVRYKPQRLWEWETIAMEMAHQYAPGGA